MSYVSSNEKTGQMIELENIIKVVISHNKSIVMDDRYESIFMVEPYRQKKSKKMVIDSVLK